MTRPKPIPMEPSRRFFLHRSAQTLLLGSALGLAGKSARAATPNARSLVLDHTHTRERIDLVYASGEQYLPQALGGSVPLPYHIISGYRGPLTNARLRSTRGGGVAKRSLHMEGKAIDVRLPGVPLAELRDAALSLKAGGVGYYPRDQFVHIDTGRVRAW